MFRNQATSNNSRLFQFVRWNRVDVNHNCPYYARRGFELPMDAGNLLFPALYQFENGLRIALDSFLQTCYGPDWWDVSLKGRLSNTFVYAETQRKKLDAMPWIGDSSAVKVLPVHLITLGQLEEIVKVYQSDCIPQLFPNIEFFVGHMELIKRVRNMYSHMFPCITPGDCQIAKSEMRVLARHINSLLS